jgi:L-threonylcarbamoyladenylate synthase
MPVFDASDPLNVQACARHLAGGALVAFPTETVYGLGARADDDAAVAAIFSAKGRPSDHPLIVHVAATDDVAYFSPQPGQQAQRLMDAFWPGPLTVIVQRHPAHGAAAAGGQNSIGLRMPAHPAALALLQAARALGVRGVAGPSANRFGRVSPTRAAHVEQEFGPALWVLDGGDCPVGIESAIVDCTRAQPALLRPGQLGRSAIEAVLDQALAAPDAASPRAPGTLAAHYAPRAAVRLFDPASLAEELRRLSAEPARRPGSVGVYSRVAPRSLPVWVWRPMPATPAAVAQELFSVLRDLDAAGVASILVEQPPASPEWDGVRDRLQRAAAA